MRGDRRAVRRFYEFTQNVVEHDPSTCGPEIMSYREIAELAFEVLGKPPQNTSPSTLGGECGHCRDQRVFSKHRAALAVFLATAMTSDIVAPSTGTHKLKTHFEECTQGSS